MDLFILIVPARLIFLFTIGMVVSLSASPPDRKMPPKKEVIADPVDKLVGHWCLDGDGTYVFEKTGPNSLKINNNVWPAAAQWDGENLRVCWVAPYTGWYRLSSDGACLEGQYEWRTMLFGSKWTKTKCARID